MTAVADRVAVELGVPVTSSRRLDGGEIGTVTACALADGRRVVAKTGATPLDVEARALRRLAAAGLPTPDVLAVAPDLLVLEHVPHGEWTPRAAEALGERVARLHGTTRDAYGYPEATWKGRLELPNDPFESWPRFFAANRLRPTASAAREAGGITDDSLDRVRALADDLDKYLPANPPAALLHGDLWRNNVVPGDGDVRAVLDPASSYGDPAVDVTYADWCGLDDAFRRGYESVRPLSVSDATRTVYELSFALDHAFHFPDDGYDAAVDDALCTLGR
ncbi:fructosamine kinase family protein [Halocalculus aciditolerans]|uniref:Aminoglycoside phosphotransferase n=1 Tax=Halocalculus aciditolerans TaxID=1383812 RepID=A0A830FIP5_9EURY|nr:fructosamine kinase family protein [Halocalculus aciditolerans]GGL56699.1 aminoglycoside phosphotransferase [Halocalculus aciditolerans]